ncbi:glycosyltransferase family A protein, partial [Actinoplanes sp. NPDC051633]|uniref:glycosyltransferase family A protein n=1 Tax=Actinoplanes sp. NPDC051633 TaxID=3155670 RepID=UPI00341ED783
MINGTNFVQRVGDAERVTSVVTTYAPGSELLASIRSLVAQSWTNHEILLVDDGSPHGHDDVLRTAAGLDPRIRLLRRRTHEGRYAARNAAMDRATGAYVTFQESDSWSHPRRLERQVTALRADPGAAGVTCTALLTAADLDGGTLVRGPLLIRRTGERFDRVRHGGEDEFVERLRSVVHLDGESLAVLLRRGGDRKEAARRAYRSAYRVWHRRSAGAPPVKPWPLLDRRGRRACDVLLVADWTREDAGLGQVRALKDRGLRVMLLHLGSEDDLDPRTQEAVNDGEAELVDLTDDVRARLVVIRDPGVLAAAQ